MIKLSELVAWDKQIKKIHETNPDKAYDALSMMMAIIFVKGNQLKVCTINSKEPYPFMQGKVKYENYVDGNFGKVRILMPKENLFVWIEMVMAGVRGKILYDYAFNNLYFGTND